jgi:hypothetical protein
MKEECKIWKQSVLSEVMLSSSVHSSGVLLLSSVHLQDGIDFIDQLNCVAMVSNRVNGMVPDDDLPGCV